MGTQANHTNGMPTVAVTGANGFIASHLITKLIKNGHSVRATVRSVSDESKLAHLNGLMTENPGMLEVLEVADLNDTAALTTAFTGCDGVFHMAAVHPQYGFKEENRDAIIATAVQGTVSAMNACAAAGVKRVVLTSSLAAVECGNDEGVLSESTWAKEDVYDSPEKLQTQWYTHYTYVKSKVEQERAAQAIASEKGLDLRVVVPGNLCIGPIANGSINGTMTRIKDIMSGTNTLKGAADLGIVHVFDVVEAHVKCMEVDSASGRYLVTKDMVQIEDLFATLKQLYPDFPVAAMENMDIASGVQGKTRSVQSRAEQELGMQLTPLQDTLKDSVDAMIQHKMIPVPAC